MEIDWQEVLIRALDGDQQALGALCQEYMQPRIRPLILQRVRHWQDAEDLTQQVFEKVVQHASRIRQRSLRSFEAFVIIVARNACIEFWRKRLNDPVSRQSASDAPDDRSRPDRAFERDELTELLNTAVEGQLSEDERELLVMRILLDWSFRKIEEQTGISVSTLHARYQRALQKLGEAPDVAAYSTRRRRNRQ